MRRSAGMRNMFLVAGAEPNHRHEDFQEISQLLRLRNLHNGPATDRLVSVRLSACDEVFSRRSGFAITPSFSKRSENATAR